MRRQAPADKRPAARDRDLPIPAAVLFDVDGTLVDSERAGHRVAFNDAFGEFGLPDRWDVATYGRLLDIAGGRRRLRHYLLEAGYPEGEVDDLAARLHTRKTEILQEMIAGGRIDARPGARKLIDEIADRGVTLAAVTTGSRPWVEPLLDRLFGLERFATLVTGTEVPERKPAPDAYEVACRELGVRPEDTIAVEDSEKGLVAARAIGIPCVIVVNDYTAGENFDGAVLVVDGFAPPELTGVLAGPPEAVADRAVTFATLCRCLA